MLAIAAQVSVAASGVGHENVTASQSDGKSLPEPEFLQPRLDKDLPSYRPCAPQDLADQVEGSAPFILPNLVARWLAGFQKHYPQARLSVPPPYLAPQGSLSPPLQKFLDGHSDFAFLTRDLAASDVAAFHRAHGFDPISIPVAAGAYRHFGFVDAVGVVVNRDNPIKGLTFAQIDAIFSQSRLRGHAPVTTWGDLGVTEWASQPVHVVGATAWNGEESARAIVMHDRILSVGDRRGKWRTDLPSKGTEADVPDLVAADRYAIGFTGMGHLAEGIKTVALSDRAEGPWYDATYENVARADYPLSRVVFIVLAKKPGQPLKPVLREFVRFLLSREGQQHVLDQGIFLPLHATQIREYLRLLEQGQTPAACSTTAAP